MENKLLKLIKKEDEKNPLTDIQIAKLLKTRREEVSLLRKKLDVPDSRERRKPYLVEAVNHMLSSQPSITNTDLTLKLNHQGFNISRFLVSQMRQTLEGCNLGSATNLPIKNKKILLDFNIIGAHSSLKYQTSQAKAAILYPPNGLNIAIIGDTGTGKSYLAEEMYKYAIKSKTLSENAPFVAFNCADYASNPQLLISNLFGHKKGSFTNAITDKLGLVEVANNGILFLDEVHRLPPEGQEMLFFLIDKGKYKKLGESKEEISVNVRIIAATTEDINSSILFTFKRRFPVIIKLPRLDERPKKERLLYIKKFFFEEACKINMPIKLDESAVKAFMFYNCPGSIGQLIADIQVSCSKGYLNYLNSDNKDVTISLCDLPKHVQNSYPSVRTQGEFVNLSFDNITINPSNGFQKDHIVKNQYVLDHNIYKYIENRLKDLKSKDISSEDIEQILENELNNITENFIQSISLNQQPSTANLENILGKKVIAITNSMIIIAKKYIDNIDSTLFSCLAFHLSAALNRLNSNKPIINMQLKHIKIKLKSEYKIAQEMVSHINEEYKLSFGEDEVGFIALYIHQICISHIQESKRVSVIVATHGCAAQSIVDVANTVVGVTHAKALVMSLEENFSSILEKAIKLVQGCNEGKGFVLLSDMGSLCFLAELITNETGIPSMSFDRVDTLMVIEVLKKAILPETDLRTMETLHLGNNKMNLQYSSIENIEPELNKAILTLCITGKGSAIKIKELLKSSIKDIDNYVDIIPMGALDNFNTHKFIEELCLKKDIIAIVGTIDPNFKRTPFIPLFELIKGDGIVKLKQLLNLKTPIDNKNINYASKPSQFIHLDAIWPNQIFQTKTEVLDRVSNELFNNGFVTNNFKVSVYKRESLGDTIYRNSIAIPHATAEETIKPVLGILTLKEPILWSENYYVNIVFFPVFQEDNSEMLNLLYLIANNKILLKNISKANTQQDIINYITHSVENTNSLHTLN